MATPSDRELRTEEEWTVPTYVLVRRVADPLSIRLRLTPKISLIEFSRSSGSG